MAIDFPSSPAVGQQHPFTPIPGQPVFIWDGSKWVPAPLTGAVRYDAVQSLSGSQQTQARDNIGASSGGTTGAVRYDTAQTLTTAQQLQARQNIYAAPFESAMSYSGMQINGGMEVSQERGATGTASGYIVDGWALYSAGTMGVGASYFSPSSVPGFPAAIYMSVSTAQTTIGATDQTVIYQNIEGYRIARLAWGTASASPITIGFWSKHHRTGVFSVAIRNGASNRSYVATYTHAAADIAQYNVVTVPGCVNGVWPTDNTAGMTVLFPAAMGSTYTAPAANTWYSANYTAAPGQVNGVGATSDIFYITGVTVLPGTQAPTAAQSPNIMRPYDQELVMCQRYWQQYASIVVDTSAVMQSLTYVNSMRALPTITGGGAGFAIVGNSVNSMSIYQTTRGIQTITLDARL